MGRLESGNILQTEMIGALAAGECDGIIERQMHVQYLEALGEYPVQVLVDESNMHAFLYVCICI